MAKYSYSSAKDRADKRTSGFDSTSIKLPEGAQLFKVTKPGIYKLDIIPFVAGEGNPFADAGVLHYERTYYAHRGIGANGDTYICPSKTSKDPCPICEHRRQLMKDPEANEELIKDLAPKERQLFQLIDLGAPDKGVQIWDVSYHLFGKLLDARIRDAEEGDDYHLFYHLTKGLTLRVGFTERSFGGVTFYEAETIDFKPRREPYDEEVLEKGYCLDELLKIESYDKLKAALLQTEDDDAPKKKKPAADDDDEPVVKKKKPVDDDDEPAPKKKPAPADDDDEPVVKKKRPADDDDEPAPKKKPPVDDDDWDAPKKKKPADDDDEPVVKKKPAPADDDDEPVVKKKKPVDDDDEPAPKKKPASADDDDEPVVKKKKPADDDDEPAPKKKPAADDDDEPVVKKKKPASDADWD